VKIRVKTSSFEVEIEGEPADIQESLRILPEILLAFSPERLAAAPREIKAPEEPFIELDVKVEKDESLRDVVMKLFSSPWGRKVRKMEEVRSALNSLGLIYPRSSVAVTLLRLTASGKLRRFKQPDGEYGYVVATPLAVQSPNPEKNINSERTG